MSPLGVPSNCQWDLGPPSRCDTMISESKLRLFDLIWQLGHTRIIASVSELALPSHDRSRFPKLCRRLGENGHTILESFLKHSSS